MPNANEPSRKQVQQEPAKEFIERKSHQPLFVFVSGIAPAKSDLLFGQRDQSMRSKAGRQAPLDQYREQYNIRPPV